MARQISDPELRKKLTTDYDFGCKRPTFSNDYFKAFTRDNVFLETTPIERIEADGIVTSDGTTLFSHRGVGLVADAVCIAPGCADSGNTTEGTGKPGEL